MPRSMAVIAATVLLVAARLVDAAPGDLDPTFGVGGTIVAPIPGFIIDGHVLPDGRILAVGGTVRDGYYTITLARFESDGSPDATFGSGGVVTTPLGDGNDLAFAMALQPDGRFLVAGEVDGDAATTMKGDALVLRYLADGTLDPSFGDGGVVRTSFGPQRDIATSVLYQPNGKVVIAGVTYLNHVMRFALARFENDGAPDPTFGTAGKVTTALRTSDSISSAALQPDGKIVVGGTSSTVVNTADWDVAFARYRADGTLDAGFGTNGVFITDLGASLSGINDLVLQPDGKIIGVGSRVPSASSANQALVMRLDPNGAPDAGFGVNGVLATTVDGAYIDDGVLVQPDGRIVAAGLLYFHSGGNEGFNSMVMRINPGGTLDGGFGAGGVVGFDMGGYDFWRAVRRQQDGKLLTLGSANATTTGGFAMARYEGTPAACGNGVTEPPETCDDGNTTPGDGCDGSCSIEPGYACAGSPSVCTPGCGDGTVSGSEQCDDGALVSDDGCDAACRIEPGWTCTGAPSSCAAVCGDSRIVGAEQCDDGNTMNGDCCSASCELDAAGTPCVDDGNLCSADVCGAAGVCQHAFTPDPTCLVPIAPGKAKLKILARGAGKDQVQFTWTKGPAVPKATFGTPSAGTPQYAMCLYDETSGTPAAALSAIASGDGNCADKVCWSEKPSGWQLKSVTGVPDGIVALKLKQGLEEGKSKVQVTMKGSRVALPPLPLANDPRVVAQLRSSDGQCYGATFSAPTTNDDKAYKARSD